MGKRTAKATPMFRQWREAQGMSQSDAAVALDVSLSQIKNWDAGVDRGRGTPSEPPYAVRCLMWALAEGIEVKPWGQE